MDSGWGYVTAGWLLTFGAIAGYAVWTIVRGRKLSRQVPDEERRWL